MPTGSVNTAFWLAGAAAAHSIAAIGEGRRLTPTLATVDASAEISVLPVTGHELSFEELVSQRFRVDHSLAVRLGTGHLDLNPTGAVGAVLITDQVLDMEARPVKVLLLDIRAYGEQRAACTMIIPYRSAGTTLGFGTHRPTVIDVANVHDDALERLMGVFFAGMESHRTGWRVWSASVVRELDTFYAA